MSQTIRDGYCLCILIFSLSPSIPLSQNGRERSQRIISGSLLAEREKELGDEGKALTVKLSELMYTQFEN